MNPHARIGLKLIWTIVLAVLLVLLIQVKHDFVYRAF